MLRGDHIYVRRIGYTHHGIDVGDGRVVHFSAEEGKNKVGACIRYATLEEFAQGGDVIVKKYGKRFGPDETVARAESKLGESDYDLFGRNCEHFASWCVTGHGTSPQTEAAAATGSGFAVAATTFVLAAGPLAVAGVSYGLFRAVLRWRSARTAPWD